MQIELIALDLFSLTHLSSQTGHFRSPHPIDSILLFSRGKASSQPIQFVAFLCLQPQFVKEPPVTLSWQWKNPWFVFPFLYLCHSTSISADVPKCPTGSPGGSMGFPSRAHQFSWAKWPFHSWIWVLIILRHSWPSQGRKKVQVVRPPATRCLRWFSKSPSNYSYKML